MRPHFRASLGEIPSAPLLLDTNMVSYIVRGRSPAARRTLAALKLSEQYPCVSAITAAELRYGLAKRPEAITLQKAVEEFLLKITVLAWGQQEANVYGALRAKLEGQGIGLGNLDLLIAAHAIAIGAALVTHDAAFGRVESLTVLDWASDVAPVIPK